MESGRLAMDSENLYISEPPLRKVYVIDNRSFTLLDSLEVPEGEGPGELMLLHGLDVTPGHIVISDERGAKVQIWDKQKELIKEFLIEGVFPREVRVWEDGNVTIQSPTSMADGFVFYTVDQEGNIINTFGDVSNEEYHPIRFSGRSWIDDGYYYFAGYSEHILAKWDHAGTLQYSRSAIDDVPSEFNHPVFGGNQTVFRFSEHAIFSAVWTIIYEDYWIVVHRGIWDEDPYIQYLDVYNKHNGDYLSSLVLPYQTGYMVLDDQYMYLFHRNEDMEVSLAIYENNLEELIGRIPGL